uniref:Solute carrier family 13 member 1 n=1 Tax=Pseudonaja textilis TaxID=8673 RepID=A0A670Y944_PSETE
YLWDQFNNPTKKPYFHLLLTGIICLATSIEKWNLHKRIALKMVMLVGVNPAWLTLGFMISCAFLSMWLSNTSTAAMVMPIVEAVAQQITSAEAEVDAMDMTYANGTTNPALELEGKYSNGTAQAVCDIENEKVLKIIYPTCFKNYNSYYSQINMLWFQLYSQLNNII